MNDETNNAIAAETAETGVLSNLIEKIEAENYQQALYAKKQYRLTVISALCCVMVLVVAIISALILVPRALSLMGQLESVLNTDLPEMMRNVNVLIENADKGLSDTFNQVSQIDFESLNSAIIGLQKTIEPLARLFGGK